MSAVLPLFTRMDMKLGHQGPFIIDAFPSPEGGFVSILRNVTDLPFPRWMELAGSDATVMHRVYDADDALRTWADWLQRQLRATPTFTIYFYEPMRVTNRVGGAL